MSRNDDQNCTKIIIFSNASDLCNALNLFVGVCQIQVMIDQRDDKGIFILTRSHQFKLQQAITQSLAGRTAMLTLLPMSLSELEQAG